MTDVVAAEVRDYGVKVFAIHPGTVETPLSESLRESELLGRWAPWFRAVFEESHQTPIELPVKLVVWIASGHADALSGRCLEATANLDELAARAEEIQRQDLYTLRLRR